MLERAAEPQIDEGHPVAARLERGRDVLHAERLDAEERTEAEALVSRDWSEQQDVHRERPSVTRLRWYSSAPPSLCQLSSRGSSPRLTGAAPSLSSLVLALSGLFAVAAMRVRFDADVLSLLPRIGAAIPAFRRYLSAFGGIDELYVIFTAPEGRSVADYDAVIEEWATALRDAPEIAQVDTGVADGSRELRVARRSPAAAAERRSARKVRSIASRRMGCGTAVASQRELLALPSPVWRICVRQDPAGLSEICLGFARRTVGTCALHPPRHAGTSARTDAAGSSSSDPPVHPTKPQFSRALDARLTAIRATVLHAPLSDDPDEPSPRRPCEVAFAGGHRIALETEAVDQAREHLEHSRITRG